jgi:hypothetical protein
MRERNDNAKNARETGRFRRGGGISLFGLGWRRCPWGLRGRWGSRITGNWPAAINPHTLQKRKMQGIIADVKLCRPFAGVLMVKRYESFEGIFCICGKEGIRQIAMELNTATNVESALV